MVKNPKIREICVSVPLRGLGFFSDKYDVDMGGIMIVSVPLRGLGFFSCIRMVLSVYNAIVSVPLRGLGFFSTRAIYYKAV